MTTQLLADALLKLSQSWRKNATELGRASDPNGIWNDTLQTCAHELESALAAHDAEKTK